MNTKTYYTASIWLGILPILLVSLTWIAGIYAQPPSENTFLLPYSFASAINAFFFPYALSVLWIRMIELSGSSRKLAFLQKLWWVGFVLMVLFWIMTGISELTSGGLPNGGGWTVYPPLSALNPQKDTVLQAVFNKLLLSLLSASFISTAAILHSASLCIVIAIYWRHWITFRWKLFSGLLFLLSGIVLVTSLLLLTGSVILIAERFLNTSLLLFDIYIGTGPLDQVTATSFDRWKMIILRNWEELLYVAFLLVLGITTNHKNQISRVSIGFMLLGVISAVRKILSSEEIIDVQISAFKKILSSEGIMATQIHDTFFVTNSPSEIWYMYFGLVTIIYQLIIWNRQRLLQWLAYMHSAVTGTAFLLVLLKKEFGKLEYGLEIASFLLIFIAVSQLFILINYWFSNYRKTKPSVM